MYPIALDTDVGYMVAFSPAAAFGIWATGVMERRRRAEEEARLADERRARQDERRQLNWARENHDAEQHHAGPRPELIRPARFVLQLN